MVNVRDAQTADIRLIAAPLSVVSGTVFNSKDAPVPSATLHLAHGDYLFGIDNSSAVVRPDGTFAFGGMAPGTYFLQYRESAWPPPRDETPVVSMATVVVDRGDVTGVRVVPIRTVPVEGRLIVADADRASLPSDLIVSVAPVDWQGNPGPHRPGRLNADLTFSLDTWPRPGLIRVLPENAGWTIKSVRYRGADVTDTGIDFKEGTRVTGIEVELVRGR